MSWKSCCAFRPIVRAGAGGRGGVRCMESSLAQCSGAVYIGRGMGEIHSKLYLCRDQRYVSLSQVLCNFLELLWAIVAHSNSLHQALLSKGAQLGSNSRCTFHDGRWATTKTGEYQILHRKLDAVPRLSSALAMRQNSQSGCSMLIGCRVFRTPSGHGCKVLWLLGG